MRRGGNALLFTAALATAGCVTDSNQVQIRPIADPFIKATRAGSPAIAEGRGLLAMGSVGLAIEAFHKALREQPDSIEALAGLAECYDQMGRHDLSQAKYEAALAIAPKDPTLLRTFAASLERQGRYAEAKQLRGEADSNEREEAAALVRMAPVAPAPVQPHIAPVPVRVAAAPAPRKAEPAKTVVAPPAPPVVQARPAPVSVAALQPVPAPAPVKTAAAEPQPPAARPMPAAPQVGSSPMVSRTAWAIESTPIATPPEATASVTVKLPAPAPQRVEAPKVAASMPQPAPTPQPRAEPAKMAVAALPHLNAPEVAFAAAPIEPAEAADAAPSVTVKLPPAMPAALPPEKPVAATVRRMLVEATPPKEGPRLERLSMGEVALVTQTRPRWKAQPVRYTAIASPPRFVPLADLPGNYGLRLLNAARHDGLAARTRLALNGQGWKSVTIGDSARVRQHSLVLYSEATEKAARRLAKQMGIWIAKDARPGPLTVLLGRDWATRRQARA